MEIEFITIKKLAKVNCDLMITVATEEILRSIKQWFSNQSIRSETLNKFFGDENWKQELSNVDTDREIFDYYSNKIVKEAFKKTTH